MSGKYKVLIITTVTFIAGKMSTSVIGDFDSEINAEIAIEKLTEANDEEGGNTFIRAIRLYIPQSEQGL